MFWPRLRGCAGACVVVAVMVGQLWFVRAAVGANEKKEMLTPCLAVAADGSPVGAAVSFPSSKRLTVVFRIPENSKAKMLNSRWIAKGEGDKVIAENNLDLEGQKTGWLRLLLKQPAPAGKYRLETKLDEKAWKSVDLEITPAIEKTNAEKPTDLIPLTEGKSMTYQMVVQPAAGTTVEIPGVKPAADGSSRANLTMTVGKAEDAGTHYDLKINDQPTGDMWVKLDDKGMQAYRRKMGDQTKDLNPPEMIQPLPPSLEDGTEWKSKSQSGNEQELQLIGPMMLDGPNGSAAGYLVFSKEQVTAGAPGVEASRGSETIERYYIPKVGLVREVHVSTLNGKLTSRQEIALATGLPYKIVPNPEMKGRLGRVQFAYPPESKSSEARVAVFKAGAKADDKPVHSGYGDQKYDLMPGKYEVAINNKRVPVEVKSGHSTIPCVGTLRIHAGAETQFHVFDKPKEGEKPQEGDAEKQKELHSGYGDQDVQLPVGTYLLEVAGSSEPVKITEGQITEF